MDHACLVRIERLVADVDQAATGGHREPHQTQTRRLLEPLARETWLFRDREAIQATMPASRIRLPAGAKSQRTGLATGQPIPANRAIAVILRSIRGGPLSRATPSGCFRQKPELPEDNA